MPTKDQYQKRVKQLEPRRPLGPNMLKAFLTGGLICSVGEIIAFAGERYLHLSKTSNAQFVVIVLIFLGALFTGFGIYDRLVSWGGAGAVVPITGFANSMASPAMEFKKEGYIMGVGAKLFTLAGPVIVYGLCISALAGVVALFWR